jgi:hypothetical protein
MYAGVIKDEIKLKFFDGDSIVWPYVNENKNVVSTSIIP